MYEARKETYAHTDEGNGIWCVHLHPDGIMPMRFVGIGAEQMAVDMAKALNTAAYHPIDTADIFKG